MSRYMLVALIVLGLALLGLTLVRAQALPTDDPLAGKAPASCVTVCPLPGEGGNLSSMAGQPIGVERGTEGFHSSGFDYPLPAQASSFNGS